MRVARRIGFDPTGGLSGLVLPSNPPLNWGTGSSSRCALQGTVTRIERLRYFDDAQYRETLLRPAALSLYTLPVSPGDYLVIDYRTPRLQSCMDFLHLSGSGAGREAQIKTLWEAQFVSDPSRHLTARLRIITAGDRAGAPGGYPRLPGLGVEIRGLQATSAWRTTFSGLGASTPLGAVGWRDIFQAVANSWKSSAELKGLTFNSHRPIENPHGRHALGSDRRIAVGVQITLYWQEWVPPR